jgi:hypothetical protein
MLFASNSFGRTEGSNTCQYSKCWLLKWHAEVSCHVGLSQVLPVEVAHQAFSLWAQSHRAPRACVICLLLFHSIPLLTSLVPVLSSICGAQFALHVSLVPSHWTHARLVGRRSNGSYLSPCPSFLFSPFSDHSYPYSVINIPTQQMFLNFLWGYITTKPSKMLSRTTLLRCSSVFLGLFSHIIQTSLYGSLG